MSKPADWKLTLRPPADNVDPTGQLRVRRALKALLRSYGLRCIAVERTPAEEVPAPPPASTGPS